jgi:hypothetical protein
MPNVNKINLEEKELELLRNAVDIAEAKTGEKIKLTNDIANIIKILEDFLRRKKVVCYGGTAINNILPAGDQFYDKDVEIPDYDFYSPMALNHAKELADIYAAHDFEDVEVRSGMHKETYKVFVNFIPIADITQYDHKIFKVLIKQAIRKEGIYYASPEYLRMQMYNELSRPDGDVSRWEKVYKRLLLLNKNHPVKENPKCSQINFMRDFTGNPELNDTLYSLVKDTMINEGVVFIGGYASSLYSRYMPEAQKKQLQHVPDFDVLAENPKTIAYILKDKLEEAGFKNVKINKKPDVADGIIMAHYEVVVDEDTLCFIYQPIGCHSYNTLKIQNKTVKVATIDTMLLFLLAFLYANRPYYDHERIHCMAQYLINVQAKNRLEQKGLLKRFNINCYGKEKNIVELRSEKASKYAELKSARDDKEYNKLFFKYIPQKGKKRDGKKHNNQENSPSSSSPPSSPPSSSSSRSTVKYHKNKYHKGYKNTYKKTKKNYKKGAVKSLFDKIW